MTIRFGPDDEEAFYRARGDLLAAYAEAQDGAPVVDTFMASMMLSYKWGYGDGRIHRWTHADLEGLLLDYFPRKVSLDADDQASVPAEAGDFLSFLDRRGLLSGDPLPRLLDTLDKLKPAFLDAMAGDVTSGFAKRIGAHLLSTGVDIADEQAVAAAIESFNAMPLDERDAILGTQGLVPGRAEPGLDDWDAAPSPLPPITLAPPDELEAAARASAALARLTTFTAYFQRPHRLTQQGRLPLADGRGLAGILGLEDEFDPRIGKHVYRTRSTAQMRGLDLTFRWARAAGFVKVRNGSISATQRGRTLGKRPLEDWSSAFEAFVTRGVPGARRDDPYQGPYWMSILLEILEGLPVALYRTGGTERTLLHEVARELLDFRYLLPDVGTAGDPRQWIGEDLDRRIVGPLMELGAVVESAGTLTLTPLGYWATNRWLRAAGEAAPITGELAGATASALLDACAHMSLDDADQEIRAWIGGRPDTAATELADAARSPALVVVALHALGFAGPSAEVAVRGLLDVPSVRPQAMVWLVDHGYEDPSTLPPEVLQHLFIESLASMLEDEGPDAMAELVESLGPEDEQVRSIEDLMRADHPRTTDVLVAIGRHHRSKSVAKAARTIAFRRQGIRPN